MMQNINYLIVGILLLTIGLFFYLLYCSINIFYLRKKAFPLTHKNKMIRKKQLKKYRVKLEGILKIYQIVVGFILILLLLIILIILKVEVQSNQLVQSNYEAVTNQRELEKKVNKQNQTIKSLIHLEVYPEKGLTALKINSNRVWQEPEQEQLNFTKQLTQQLGILFPDCETTIELTPVFKRLTLNLKENDPQLVVVRKNRELLIKELMNDLVPFESIKQFVLNETLFEKDAQETIFIRNTEEKFFNQEGNVDNSNEGLTSHGDNK